MNSFFHRLGSVCCGLLGIAFLFAASPPALATPPDVIDIQDEPFGLSSTHLFVLRTADDNLGLYQSSRVETFLVAIDLETSEEEYWPVYRGLRTVDYDGDGNELGVVVRADEVDDLAQPFGILAQRGGLPWSALQRVWRADGSLVVIATADAFVIDRDEGPHLTLTRMELRKRLAATSAAMTVQISNYRRMSSLQTRELFADRKIDDATCDARDVWEPFFPFAGKRVTIVRLACMEDEDDGTSSLIQLFPAVRDTRSR